MRLPSDFQAKKPSFQATSNPYCKRVPTPSNRVCSNPPYTPQALEAAFSGAFGPLGGSPRRGKLLVRSLLERRILLFLGFFNWGEGM